MSRKILLGIVLVFFALGTGWFALERSKNNPASPKQKVTNAINNITQNPLEISAMRAKQYPGSDLVIEQTLEDGSNYHQYIASYMSDGLKIYGLLTVPIGEKPVTGWPVVIFNHGYIPPRQYRTTERYIAYVDAFARYGYIVFKSDYRGNGSSQGQPEGAYYSPAYTTDVLNALSSVKKYKDADPNRIGMWGHSMGGNITLRALEISPDIKVAVIWGGVVGSYDDLINHWHTPRFSPPPEQLQLRNNGQRGLIQKYGQPNSNPAFWNGIDPTTNLALITAPLQLDVGSSDEEVPPVFSEELQTKMKTAGNTVEFYSYPGSDHNISQGFDLAMQRSVDFMDKYLKPRS
jgi:uncharacterized protein